MSVADGQPRPAPNYSSPGQLFPTSEAENGAAKEAANAVVDVVVLLAEVGGGDAGELVDAADGTWCGRSEQINYNPPTGDRWERYQRSQSGRRAW